MALLNEIGARLASSTLASSSGANGWLLIKGWLPDSSALPNKVVALIETPGGPANLRAEIDQPAFQVVVRGESMQASTAAYTDAQTEADAIKRDLHARGNESLSGRWYVSVTAQQDPFLLEIDAQKRPVLVCNFIAQRSRT